MCRLFTAQGHQAEERIGLESSLHTLHLPSRVPPGPRLPGGTPFANLHKGSLWLRHSPVPRRIKMTIATLSATPTTTNQKQPECLPTRERLKTVPPRNTVK